MASHLCGVRHLKINNLIQICDMISSALFNHIILQSLYLCCIQLVCTQECCFQQGEELLSNKNLESVVSSTDYFTFQLHLLFSYVFVQVEKRTYSFTISVLK